MAVAFSRYIDGTASSASTTVASVNLSACSVGDLVFVDISLNSTQAVTVLPSGWVQLQEHSSTYAHRLFWKILESGDIGTVSWTFGTINRKILAKAYVITGHDPTNPIAAATKGTFETEYGATVDCGTFSTSNTWVVAFCSGYSTSSRTYAALSGWTERRDHGSTAPDFWKLQADTNDTWGGGTCAPDFTYDSAVGCTYRGGFLVAINPAATAPTITTRIILI